MAWQLSSALLGLRSISRTSSILLITCDSDGRKEGDISNYGNAASGRARLLSYRLYCFNSLAEINLKTLEVCDVEVL